jgi:glutamyl-tRNA synthetase
VDGRLPSWRLRLEPGEVTWPEEIAAPGRLEAATAIGDVVLRRADGFLAYHLATAVDELALGIGTVLRGEDLWASSGPQVAVMELLGGEPPRYWHVPLLAGADGERLAKREGGLGLAALRRRGLDAAEVIGLLAGSVGLVPEGSRLSAGELLSDLNLEGLRARLRQPRNHSIS